MRRHPAGASDSQGGRFAPGDASRSEAGQVVPKPQPPPRFGPPTHATFKVVQEVDHELAQALMNNPARTVHANHRQRRLSASQPGDIYKAALVDRGRGANNMEVHVITDNAEVHIFSARSGKLITMLYARPKQIVRYAPHERVPEHIMEAARNNVAARKHLS